MDPSGSQDATASLMGIENLELRALEQRNRLHNTAAELKEKVLYTRKKFDVSNQAQKHWLVVSVGVSVIGFLSGYVLAGQFTD